MKKGYKKYPVVFYDIYEAWNFAIEVRKYRYFCDIVVLRNRRVSLYIKKCSPRFTQGQIAWKRKNYGSNYIHQYAGYKNRFDFPTPRDEIFDYCWEWNMFLYLDATGIWHLRYTHFDITFGEIRHFPTKRQAIKYCRKIKKQNAIGLFHLKEYKDFIIL